MGAWSGNNPIPSTSPPPQKKINCTIRVVWKPAAQRKVFSYHNGRLFLSPWGKFPTIPEFFPAIFLIFPLCLNFSHFQIPTLITGKTPVLTDDSFNYRGNCLSYVRAFSDRELKIFLFFTMYGNHQYRRPLENPFKTCGSPDVTKYVLDSETFCIWKFNMRIKLCVFIPLLIFRRTFFSSS